MAGPHRWALGRRHTGGGKPHGMVASLPTGLVSFLFTDVEGSTRRFDCADCGARSTDVACNELFNRFLALDHIRAAPWGLLHGQAVSCYFLQHPSATSAPREVRPLFEMLERFVSASAAPSRPLKTASCFGRCRFSGSRAQPEVLASEGAARTDLRRTTGNPDRHTSFDWVLLCAGQEMMFRAKSLGVSVSPRCDLARSAHPNSVSTPSCRLRRRRVGPGCGTNGYRRS